jgi:uncharacterized protein YoaH (UPF0181 family)
LTVEERTQKAVEEIGRARETIMKLNEAIKLIKEEIL